jgi:micrococcal nuclease
MRWLRRLLLPLVVVVAMVGACGSSPSAPAAEPGAATVVRVVDGDTIRVRLPGGGEPEERVRLIGIDTPETHGAGGLRECFGQEATDQLTTWLPAGTEVGLVRDTEPRDRYQRLLAYVYRRDDGLFVNLALAEHGFAAPLTIPPNVAHQAEFVAAAAAAREKAKGLWGRCGGPDAPLGSSP